MRAEVIIRPARTRQGQDNAHAFCRKGTEQQRQIGWMSACNIHGRSDETLRVISEAAAEVVCNTVLSLV